MISDKYKGGDLVYYTNSKTKRVVFGIVIASKYAKDCDAKVTSDKDSIKVWAAWGEVHASQVGWMPEDIVKPIKGSEFEDMFFE